MSPMRLSDLSCSLPSIMILRLLADWIGGRNVESQKGSDLRDYLEELAFPGIKMGGEWNDAVYGTRKGGVL